MTAADSLDNDRPMPDVSMTDKDDPKPPYWLRDPTENVISLVQANKESADALREMHDRYIAAEIGIVRETVKWMEKLADTHQKHDYALHRAEAGRLDALRQNDREDVKVLAAQTTAKAEALQAQVANTADTLAKTFAANLAEQNKRLSAIERQQAEGMGKQAVADPMMEKLVNKIEMLMTVRDTGVGVKEAKTEQRDNSRYMIAIIGLLLAVLTFVLGRGGLH